MIAAIVRGGRSSSFKGALNYVLHDADGPGSERVGETQTVNLFGAPETAHKEMQVTADAARAIQARARAERGERTSASGSRAEKTCFHYALSWHPDDAPTAEHMMRCAHQTLDRLGLSRHQAVIVEHTEKPHKHLHVIVSTVDPDSGQAKGLYRNAHVLDRWCHEYEKGRETMRAFKRVAKYEREQDRQQDKAAAGQLQGKDKERRDLYDKRRQELRDKQKAEVADLKKRQAERQEKIEDRMREVRRAADHERERLRETHRKQLDEYWRKDAPNMKLESRPSGAMLRPVVSQPAEIVQALRALERTAPHMSHLGGEKAPSATMPEAKPEPPAPSQFAEAWRDRQSFRDVLETHGIEDRYDGEKAIKQFHRTQMGEIGGRKDAAMAAIRAEFAAERELRDREWAELKDRYNALHAELKREFGIPDRHQQKEQGREQEAAPEHDRHGGEIIDTKGPIEPLRPEQPTGPADVRTYVDDYLAGRGRDSVHHEQFAANHGQEIEREFQRRAAELTPEPEPDLEIATNEYGDEIIDMNFHVEPEVPQETKRETWERRKDEIEKAFAAEAKAQALEHEDRWCASDAHADFRKFFEKQGPPGEPLTELEHRQLDRLMNEAQRSIDEGLAKYEALSKRYRDLENEARAEAGLPSVEEQTIIYADHDWESSRPMPSVEPPSREPPPLEPDELVPDPYPDMDFEIGDD